MIAVLLPAPHMPSPPVACRLPPQISDFWQIVDGVYQLVRIRSMLHVHRCMCTCPALQGRTSGPLISCSPCARPTNLLPPGGCMQPLLHTAAPSAPQAADVHVSLPSAARHLFRIRTRPSPLSYLVHPLLPRRLT